MKNFYFLSLIIAFCFSANAQSSYKLPKGISPSDYISNTIIFKVKDNYRSFCNETGINISNLQNKLNSLGSVSIAKKFKYELAPNQKFNKDGYAYADLSLIYEIKFSANSPIEKNINLLLSTGVLVYAEPHFIPKTCYSPNDPMSTPLSQYHIGRIDAYNGWNISKGDSNTIIGITDTGTEPTHPDLQGNIKHNYADPIDLADNDGDGYIDNFSGWDLGSNDNDPTWPPAAGQGPHGIHVCGIAAASTDNNIGGAGIGFKCKFLPVKIADAAGSLVAAYEGIKYAADHGCKVINCSWGGIGGGQYGQDICTYATINKDVLVVCAAGNNGLDQEFFPAAYQYVTAVANTLNTDARNFTSNYGYFIDVCAPGTNINSTWTGTGYSLQTGTSMASPVVAGAAAIVRSFYPAYSALQVGERLKQTADNIYGIAANATVPNKLGTGRINLFRALTDPVSPAIVYSNLNIVDHNDGIFVAGDTIFIGGLFTNYLAPTSALNATMVALSAQAQIVSNTINLGVINMLGTKTNTATPFAFKLSGVFASNAPIDFRLDFKDGSYTASQFFTIYVNADYINITINDILTTSTSKGKIGYNQDGQIQGLGFVYNGNSILYDGGLMIGTDTTKVSDVIRAVGATNDADFGIQNAINKVLVAPKSDFDTYTEFDDAVSTTIIGVDVVQRNYAWNTAPNRKYVIWEYEITNTNTVSLTGLRVGIFADWDINNYANNKSAYSAPDSMGYSWCTDAGGKYAGIKLLTHYSTPSFYAIDNLAGGGGGYDISLAAGYSTILKYKTLKNNRFNAGGAGMGNDVCNVMSNGPFTLAPGQTIVTAYALIGGDDLADLQLSAVNAQIKYNTVASTVGVKQISLANNKVLVFPNPATNQLHININNKLSNQIFIYDATGKLVYENKLSGSTIINSSNWSRGIYFLKLFNEEGTTSSKIILE